MRYVLVFVLVGLLGLIGMGYYLFRASEARTPEPLELVPVAPLLRLKPDSGVLYAPVLAERDSVATAADPSQALNIQPDVNVCMLWGDEVEWEEDPTRELSQASLEYWVLEYRIGQIKDLSPEYVRSLFESAEELDADTANYLSLLEGPLGEAMTWPGTADIERLWREEVSQDLYARVLEWKSKGDAVVGEVSDRLSVLRSQFEGAEGEEWLAYLEKDDEYRWRDQAWRNLLAEEAQLWSAIWESDRAAYPHWAFLMEVANRHFQL